MSRSATLPEPTGTDPKVTRPPMPLGRPSTLWVGIWLACTLASLGVLGAAYFIDIPLWGERIAAGVVVTAASGALAWRTGGRPWIPTPLVALGATAVILLDREFLYAGATVATAIVVAVLALMLTQPAATFVLTAREVLVAVGVATVGGLAVTGWHAQLDHDRYDYVVLAGAIIVAAVLVYRLGAGFHGLGRRGYLVAACALLLIAMALAYSEALSRWGPTGMLQQLQDFRFWVRDTIGAVPHPIETLLGIPAIAYGVFVRARRRQGWWVVAFGAAATAPSTERFMEHGMSLQGTVLGALYSLVLGLVIGLVIIRGEQAFTGSKGTRARRAEEAEAVRPEPARTYPLS